MMTRLCLLCLYLLLGARLSAQFIGFERELPDGFVASGKKSLKLSSLYYKEGARSLEWNFTPGATIDVTVPPLALDTKKEGRYGITLWIYNEVPQQDSLRFEFLAKDGTPTYWFTYQLKTAGWRACWIAFEYMRGDKQPKEIASYRIVAPQRRGRVFLDRLTFPMKEMNLRTTPDQQMPYNNSLTFRDLWHWCRVWEWEQYAYDIPLLPSLTDAQGEELPRVEQRLTEAVELNVTPQTQIDAAYRLFKVAHIRRVGTGAAAGFTGAPIVAPDEIDRSQGELSWNDIETMLSGFAYDALSSGSKEAEQNYFTVFAYAINQGFAFGSGMGTNHHYGYQVRQIYTTAWLMRKAIYAQPNCEEILSALRFWSALAETRLPYQYGRDELLDSWHTLLMAKTVAALLWQDDAEKDRALRALSRWVSTSLNFTPGTIGGIKVDGTTFHHGGFYPAYTTGVLAEVGRFIALTSCTDYEVTREGRRIFRSAFLAMRNYCNLYEWGIGISGRHPFGGSMKKDDVAAFALLALAGDLSGGNQLFDHSLAADYLRLIQDEETPQARYFRSQGILPAQAPQGFFVYNYGAAGIFRRNDWMVTLKGYNTDVWGAEIYAKDNRYGRYQSYGSVQIMGKGSPVSRVGSGFVQEGWDWNRLPGTTTLHLPLEVLDSPLSATTMAKSRERFAGSSSLRGEHGMFAMKLMERDLKNFTKDFVARKSVFCFDNRMICLGSGIANSSATYPTETTLFQCAYRGGSQPIHDAYWLTDGYDNYYHVAQGTVRSQIAEQRSLHEKTRKETCGTFTSAWIEHGTAPAHEKYEYMVLVQPTPRQLEILKGELSYRVLRHDDTAHIVFDIQSGITAYAAFDELSLSNDTLLLVVPAETMVMHQLIDEKSVQISICDPNLNIEEKEYTTKEPSRTIEKTLLLKGCWRLANPVDGVQIVCLPQEGITRLVVACQHGQPIECLLKSTVKG